MASTHQEEPSSKSPWSDMTELQKQIPVLESTVVRYLHAGFVGDLLEARRAKGVNAVDLLSIALRRLEQEQWLSPGGAKQLHAIAAAIMRDGPVAERHAEVERIHGEILAASRETSPELIIAAIALGSSDMHRGHPTEVYRSVVGADVFGAAVGYIGGWIGGAIRGGIMGALGGPGGAVVGAGVGGLAGGIGGAVGGAIAASANASS